MDRCYFAKEPPSIETRGEIIFIIPDGAHCEIAMSPRVLRQFVLRATEALAAFDLASLPGKVVSIR